jgi:hypothetical protein
MNEHDELERELAALRPVPPSSELKTRIARTLGEGEAQWEGTASAEPLIAGGPRSRGPLWLAAICGPLAAIFTFYLLRGPVDPPVPLDTELPATAEPAIATAFDDSLPSLGTYRRALLASPESLGDLLDKHAHRPSETTPERARAIVLARSPSELETMLGEF